MTSFKANFTTNLRIKLTCHVEETKQIKEKYITFYQYVKEILSP